MWSVVTGWVSLICRLASVAATEGTLGPGRVDVAVDGLERAVLRRVGDRIAVGGGPHRGHLAYFGHGLGVAPGAGEYRHGHLGGIGDQRGLAYALHVAVVVVQRAPGRELLWRCCR